MTAETKLICGTVALFALSIMTSCVADTKDGDDSCQDDKCDETSSFRPAALKDYADWLTGHIANGGTPSHFVSKNLPLDEFRVATEDFRTNENYVSPVHTIVPTGIRHLGGGLGYATLYFEDEYRALQDDLVLGGPFVPVYTNPEFSEIWAEHAVCAHSPKEAGEHLGAYCDPCVALICDTSEYAHCCSSDWSQDCIDQWEYVKWNNECDSTF